MPFFKDLFTPNMAYSKVAHCFKRYMARYILIFGQRKNYDLPLQSRKHAHSSHCYYSKTSKCVAIHNKPHARAFNI